MNTFIKNYIKNNISYLSYRINIGSTYLIINFYDTEYKTFTNWIRLYILINIHDDNDIKIYVLDYTTKRRIELYTYDINNNTLIAIDIDDIDDINGITEHDYNTITRYIKNNIDFIKIIVMLKKYIYEYIH